MPKNKSLEKSGLQHSLLTFFILSGMCLYVIGTLATIFSANVNKWLTYFGYGMFILAIPLIIWKISVFIENKLLFKVRNRIIAFYFFAGVIPIALVILLALLTGFLFLGNISIFIFNGELQNLSNKLHSLNGTIIEYIYKNPNVLKNPQMLHETFQTVLVTQAPELPDLSVILYKTDENGIIKYISIDSPIASKEFQKDFLPDWLQRLAYYGTVLKRNSLMIYSHKIFTINNSRYYLDIFIPFRKPLLDYLVEKDNFYSVVTLTENKKQKINGGSDVLYRPFNGFVGKKPKKITLGELQSNLSQFNKQIKGISFVSPLSVTDWFTKEHINKSNKILPYVLVKVTLKSLIEKISAKSFTGKLLLDILLYASLFFLFVELVSFFIGFTIIRSTTKSIKALTKGTNELRKGNFNISIHLKTNDELGLLGKSFNSMAKSIKALLNEVSEKHKMQKEIEIAQMVQRQFFPYRVPVIDSIDIAGKCLPAKIVSGDFYDFIQRGPSIIDIVLGDISGKGISAALMMANLQSAIRAQPICNAGNIPEDIKSLQLQMQMLNSHLLEFTPPEKFSTLFYGRIISKRDILLYCNAGHEPPFFFSGSKLSFLNEGGTILGVFSSVTFKFEALSFTRGDIITIVSDGAVESLNSKGEEFTRKKISQIIRENLTRSAEQINNILINAILEWSDGCPQHDDITVVTIKHT